MFLPHARATHVIRIGSGVFHPPETRIVMLPLLVDAVRRRVGQDRLVTSYWEPPAGAFNGAAYRRIGYCGSVVWSERSKPDGCRTPRPRA